MTHPDEEITLQYREQMNALAQALDEIFNDGKRPKQTCFVLLVAPFEDTEGRVNYISNGVRSDIVVLLKEVLARFEGQAEVRGTA